MTPNERDLQIQLGDHDRVISHSTFSFHGFPFIETEGHGFLVIDKTENGQSRYEKTAKSILKNGYEGQLAYYLEEDDEAPAFLRSLSIIDNINKKKIKLTQEDISKYATEDELYLLEAENAKKEIKPKCSRCGKFVNEEEWNANGHLCNMCAEDIDMGRDKE